MLARPQHQAIALIPQLMSELKFVGPRYSPADLKRADALIERELIDGQGDDSKLVGCMLKTYLRLPWLPTDNAAFKHDLEEFVRADFGLGSLRRGSTNGRVIPIDEFQQDLWSITSIIADELARSPDYAPVARQASLWTAHLLQKTHTHYSPTGSAQAANHLFPTLKTTFDIAGIAPFAYIDMVQFGGPHVRDSIEHRCGFDALFKRMESIHPAQNQYGKINAITPGEASFVSIRTPGELARLDERPQNIFARNVFARGAIKDSDASFHAANLLCTMANALPDAGRIYICNTYGDGFNFATDRALLKLAGLRVVKADAFDSTALNGGRMQAGNHYYTLERDFALRPTPVDADEFDMFWSGRSQFRIVNQPAKMAGVRIG